MTPKYIVFYNGTEDVPDYYTMKLSDAFINSTTTPDLEVVAHVININYGHNVTLYNKCQKLKEYSILVEILACERSRIMASVLSHFDADEYVDFVKKESYDSGYDSGALNSIIPLFLHNHLTKNVALEETNLSESDFDAAVAAFKLRK